VTFIKWLTDKSFQLFSDPTLPSCHGSQAYCQQVPNRAQDAGGGNRLRSCHFTTTGAKPKNKLPTHTAGTPGTFGGSSHLFLELQAKKERASRFPEAHPGGIPLRISGMAAARLQDMTAHGGALVMAYPTVHIG
jgi:hypothetical protein